MRVWLGEEVKNCCGTPKLEVASVRVKDVKDVELTPGLAEAFTASLDASYLEYFTAACSGGSTKEAERRIAAIPEDKRYLTRVLDSLDGAFADFDTEKTLRSEELQHHLKTINYPFNFFKHADRDADGMINIGPLKRFTSDFIMDAIVMLQQIAGDIPIEAKVFWSWFVSKCPQEFENCSEDGEIKKMQQQRLSDWDFPKICQFLGYAEIAGEANHSLKPDGSRAGVPNS